MRLAWPTVSSGGRGATSRWDEAPRAQLFKGMEAPEGHAIFVMFAGVGQVGESVCSACHPFPDTLARRSKVFVGLLLVCLRAFLGGRRLESPRPGYARRLPHPRPGYVRRLPGALLLLRSLASQVSSLPHRAFCLENFLQSFLLCWQVVGEIAWNVFAPGFHYLEVSDSFLKAFCIHYFSLSFFLFLRIFFGQFL